MHAYKSTGCERGDALTWTADPSVLTLHAWVHACVQEYWQRAGRCPDLDSRVQLYDEPDEGTKASPWGACLLAWEGWVRGGLVCMTTYLVSGVGAMDA